MSARAGELSLEYQGEFAIDGVAQDLQYLRFDSPYATAPRKPETVTIEFEGHSLYLDFYKLRRRFPASQSQAAALGARELMSWVNPVMMSLLS